MSLRTIIFFGSVIFLLGGFQLKAKQPDASQTIDWYQHFFQEKSGKAVEEELKVFQTRLDEALNINDLKAVSRLGKEIGLLHLSYTHDYEKAMDLFIQSLAIEDSLNLKADQVFTYLAISQLFENTGDSFKSSESLEQALAINDQF